jgi:hypothetical protein
MKPEITVILVVLVCTLGPLAALFGSRSRPESSSSSRLPRWRTAALFAAASAVAVAVLTIYVYA